MILSILILAFVTLQRLGELVLARRNTHRLLDRGGFEVGRAHYPYIVALHTAWLGGLWLLAPPLEPNAFLVGVFGFLQAMRVWVLMTPSPWRMESASPSRLPATTETTISPASRRSL